MYNNILILPNWQHSPYLARNLHSSYAQKLTSITYLRPHNTHKHNHTTKLNIYLVTNEKALRLLNHDYVTHTLYESLSTLLGRDTQPITLNLNLKHPAHLANIQAYKDPYPSIPMKTYTDNAPRIRPYLAAWNPKNFIYTDGSLFIGNPILGASIVNPRNQTTTYTY